MTFYCCSVAQNVDFYVVDTVIMQLEIFTCHPVVGAYNFIVPFSEHVVFNGTYMLLSSIIKYLCP